MFNMFSMVADIDFTQLKQGEYHRMFEVLCEKDLGRFRNVIRGISDWKEAVAMLEKDSGIAWKLTLKMLTNGSLMEDYRVTPIKITGRRLIKESFVLFADTF